MANKSPAAALAKWKERMAGAGKAMADGAKSVTESPMLKAAAAVDKYQRGVQEAVSSGKFVQSLQDSPLSEWQSAMSGKGQQNMLNGVRDIKPSAQRAITDVVAYAQQSAETVRQLPNNTEADAKARMNAQFDAMKAYKKR